jgi:hypothetical protein
VVSGLPVIWGQVSQVPDLWPILLGPLGLTVGLIVLLGFIYRVVFVTQSIVPGSRALKAEMALETTLGLLKEAAETNKTLAAAMEERNKLDGDRLRLAQAGLLDELGMPIPVARRRRST